VRQWTVDAFASAPFHGNPACVVEPFDACPDAAWMQALAAENNQAETAFLVRSDDPTRFALRWFTPGKEAPLCGHATLAAAHVLWAELGASAEALTFESPHSGRLSVRRRGELYELDFPADPPRRIAPPTGLEKALNGASAEVWAGRLYLTAVLNDEPSVRGFTPDLAAIRAIASDGVYEQGSLLITARADGGGPHDVVSRFFAPSFGIPEDPTTGSAHCILAPLWTEKLDRNPLRFHQAYPGRGGDLLCEVRGDRVLIAGRAVTMIESRLQAAAMRDLA
jgi:PhzF family phenazine biosynthesis protein